MNRRGFFRSLAVAAASAFAANYLPVPTRDVSKFSWKTGLQVNDWKTAARNLTLADWAKIKDDDKVRHVAELLNQSNSIFDDLTWTDAGDTHLYEQKAPRPQRVP